MTRPSGDAIEVLRTVWAAEGQTADDVATGAAADDDACGPTKVCRNMKDVSFDGLAEPGSDLRSAWRDLLEREGKRDTSGGTIRDLIFGSAEPS